MFVMFKLTLGQANPPDLHSKRNETLMSADNDTSDASAGKHYNRGLAALCWSSSSSFKT
jgi:hypothetical protein